MIRAVIGAGALLLLPAASPAGPGTLILFEKPGFNGDLYAIERARPSITLYWTVGSIAVHSGEKWQVCSLPRYRGRCAILSDSVRDVVEAGMSDRVFSARPVRDEH
jgi:hypothetical protein